jgi:DNA-binding NtrC family response regulator
MPRLLCVDDEPLVLNALMRLFRQHYEVGIATSGAQALQLMSTLPFDVVISDQRMPGMSGVELLGQIRDKHPRAMRILLTGYADLQATLDAVNRGEVFRYVTKPWNNDQLRQVVQQAMVAAQTTTAVPPRPAAGATARPALSVVSGDAAAQVGVLVLDPDPALAELVRQIAPQRRIVTAASLEEAATLLEQDAQLGVLVTEARVGRDELVGILAALREARPALTSIVAARHTDAEQVIRLINQGQIYRYIGKPVPADRLAAELNGAIRRHLSLRTAPQLAVRHRVDAPAPVLAAAAAAGARSGGLRQLFARVAGLFR